MVLVLVFFVLQTCLGSYFDSGVLLWSLLYIWFHFISMFALTCIDKSKLYSEAARVFDISVIFQMRNFWS